jgi:hypothetical protein
MIRQPTGHSISSILLLLFVGVKLFASVWSSAGLPVSTAVTLTAASFCSDLYDMHGEHSLGLDKTEKLDDHTETRRPFEGI